MRRGAHNHHLKRQIPILSGILGTPFPTLPGPLNSVTSIISLPTLSFPNPVATITTDSPSSSSLSSPFPVTSSEPLASSVQSSSESPPETSTTPTPKPTPSIQQTVFETTSGGSARTVTTFVDSLPSATQSVVPPPPPKTFLQNKVLSGVVFALIGIIGLAIILAIVTFVIRRRRNNRIMKDAISFDPTSITESHHHSFGGDRGSLEKSSALIKSNNEHIASDPTEDRSRLGPRGQAYSEGSSYPYGQDMNNTLQGGYFYSKPLPAPVHEHAHGSDKPLATVSDFEGTNWGTNLAPSTMPYAPPGGIGTQNRLLKVINN